MGTTYIYCNYIESMVILMITLDDIYFTTWNFTSKRKKKKTIIYCWEIYMHMLLMAQKCVCSFLFLCNCGWQKVFDGDVCSIVSCQIHFLNNIQLCIIFKIIEGWMAGKFTPLEEYCADFVPEPMLNSKKRYVYLFHLIRKYLNFSFW